ncbi:hypothetical protein Tco_0161761 [Tanacetum coccineum]
MRNMINLRTIRDDSLLGTLKFVSKTEDYQKKYSQKRKGSLRKLASPLTEIYSTILEEELQKPKQAKKPAKKSTTMPIAGVVIRDTPSVPVSKKKAPANVDRGKGMDLLSDVAVLEAAQLKKTLKKSKQETHKLHASGSGDGVGFQPKVPDEQQDKTTGTNEGTVTNDDDVDSDADGDKKASDSEKTNFDEEDNPNLNQNDDEEEEYEEEYVHITDKYEFSDDDEEYEELYKDVNVRLKDVEHKEEGKRDADMTDAGRDGVSQEKSYEQVEDDAHVTLTVAYVTQKTKGPMQSSFVSFDFASEFLNLDNVPPTDNEVVSMMNVKVRHEEPSTRTPSLLTIPVTIFPKTSIAATTTTPSTILPITPLLQLSTPTPTPAPTTKTTTTSIYVLPYFSSLFGFDQRVSVLEKELSQLKKVDYSAQLLETIKSQIPAMVDAQLSTRLEDCIQKAFWDLFESYGKAYSLKRDREDKDKDEDPLAGSDQGFKRRKTSKDVEPSKGSKSKESKLSSSKGTMSQPKSSASKHDWFKKPERSSTPDSNWNARKTIDFRRPQTWISRIAQAEKPPLTFDELMSTPIDFSAYVMNNLKIDNLTQEHLVGSAFNLLKGTCRSQVELEYHFEECYKAITDQLDVNNPEGQEYPFDLRKPLPLIEDQGLGSTSSIRAFALRNFDLEVMEFESAHKNKEGQFRNQDNTRKHGNNEDTSSKAMLAIDGVGFDCTTYKRGLATVEEQLITYRKNEVLFSEEVAVLKREVACKDYEINVLKSEFEKVKQEKEGIEFKIKKFDKASKDLDKLLGSQITDKSKKGLGYNVVPPTHPLIYTRPKKLDQPYYSLDEFKEPEFKGFSSENSKQESNVVCDKKSDDSKENSDDSLVKEQVSKDTSSFVESSLNVDKETVFPVDKKVESVKPKNHEKPVKKSVRTHLNAQRNMVPRAVLMKTGLKPFNTARTVNTAHPKSTVFSAKPMSHFSKIAQSTGKPQQDDTGFIDSGCSRHMTRNIAYLSYFKEFDGGYVTFGEGAHGGRISCKGTLKIDSQDTKIPQSTGPPVKVGDEVVHKELGDRIERATTTASSLETEQDSGNNNKTQSMATLNGSSP